MVEINALYAAVAETVPPYQAGSARLIVSDRVWAGCVKKRPGPGLDRSPVAQIPTVTLLRGIYPSEHRDRGGARARSNWARDRCQASIASCRGPMPNTATGLASSSRR